MRKTKKCRIPYPNAAEPAYFINKIILGIQSLLVCIGIIVPLGLLMLL